MHAFKGSIIKALLRNGENYVMNTETFKFDVHEALRCVIFVFAYKDYGCYTYSVKVLSHQGQVSLKCLNSSQQDFLYVNEDVYISHPKAFLSSECWWAVPEPLERLSQWSSSWEPFTHAVTMRDVMVTSVKMATKVVTGALTSHMTTGWVSKSQDHFQGNSPAMKVVLR